MPAADAKANLTEEQSRYLLENLFVRNVPATLTTISRNLFDISMVRSLLTSLQLCRPESSDDHIVHLYVETAGTNLISPNPLFDEAWYRAYYADIAAAVSAGDFVSAFSHFVSHGIHEGRWPNFTLKSSITGESAPAVTEIDGEIYRHLNVGARNFLGAFSWISELEHYNTYGRHLNYGIRMDRRRASFSPSIGALVSEIDREFYRQRYLDGDADSDPVDHYLHVGAARGHSPTAWFDEGWYRSFYTDVRDAIRHGDVISGFQHFILNGRQEGRRPTFDLRYALEWRIPGVTAPALLDRLPHLRGRLVPPRTVYRAQEREQAPTTIWFLLPFFNVDIAFGGYAAVFAIMAAARRDGFGVGIVTTEEARPNRDYFLWRQKDGALRDIARDCPLHGRSEIDVLPIRQHDLVLAYSIWDLRLASRLAAAAGSQPPFLLVQEYEPIFFDNGSMRTLCAGEYAIDHVPVINSDFLLRFLRTHGIGVFSRARPGRQPARFHLFEHHVNRLEGQTAAAMRARPGRLLVAYARPEAHAARNLFELVILAIERACEDGLFGPEWIFVGLGALSEISDIELPRGHRMKLVPKMSEADYVASMRAVDIGISLMSAPHPSVVPFELATTGALVVTNTYENRSAEALVALCGNIVPCEESLDGIVGALRQAREQVEDFELRERRTYQPASAGWDAIFSPALVRAIFGVPTAPGRRDAADPVSPGAAATIRRLVPRTRHLAASTTTTADGTPVTQQEDIT